MFHKTIRTLIAALALAAGCAQAQNVEVRDAWVRSTVPSQKASGAFMKLTAKQGTRLVGADSPVAGITEVHEMKTVGDVMTMRAVDALELPAGQTVELKPGGYHVMMMDLKTALKTGSTIPLTLVFKDAKGVESKLQVQLPVRAMAPGADAHGAATKH